MDDDNLIRLFSTDVTLQKDGTTIQVVSGPSFLLAMVLEMETDKNLPNKGCISLEGLYMVYGKGSKYSGVYKKTQLRERTPRLDDAAEAYYSLQAGLPHDGGIPRIRDDFRKCTSAEFFYIPLALTPASRFTIKSGVDPRHANGLLVSKTKGTYFQIEPQYSPDELRADTENIDINVKKALNEIGAKDFRRLELRTTCPQYVTNDENCLFWTAYITRGIIRDTYKTNDPNVTIKKITDLGEETLRQNIDKFKQEVWVAAMKYLTENGLTWKEYNDILVSRGPVVGVPVKVVGGAYFPAKYFQGLSTRKAKKRRGELTRRKKMSFKNPKAYVPFSTDKGVKTRKSSYTERFHKKYPGATSMPAIAKATGIPKSILDQVYDRGMAAWRTGHRPGASQQAWGMARVYSFALKGKTYRTADADLARKV